MVIYSLTFQRYNMIEKGHLVRVIGGTKTGDKCIVVNHYDKSIAIMELLEQNSSVSYCSYVNYEQHLPRNYISRGKNLYLSVYFHELEDLGLYDIEEKERDDGYLFPPISSL